MFRLKEIETKSNTSTSTPLLYDPFLFVDSLTNRSIPVKNIRDRSLITRSHRHSKTQDLSQVSQIRELDECIDFLKQTTSFRKNALRQKLFGGLSKKEESLSQEEELIRKKRLIRQLISQQIQSKNRNEFEKYMTSPNHKIDQNLLKVTKSNNFLISKKTISKLVNSLEKKENFPSMNLKRKIDESDEPFLDRMNFIEQEMKNQIREKLRKSGQFLVDPQYHFVQAKSFGQARFKKQNDKHFQQQRSYLQSMKWQPNSISMQTLRNRGKISISAIKETNKHELQLIGLVTYAEIEDVEIFAEKHKKQTLKARDQKGNTLLHLAALHNKTMIFQWLLRKLGVSALLLKNQEGKTASDIAVALDRREILAHIPKSMI